MLGKWKDINRFKHKFILYPNRSLEPHDDQVRVGGNRHDLSRAFLQALEPNVVEGAKLESLAINMKITL